MTRVLPLLIILVGISLIVVHGLWPDAFAVDGITILILFVLSIPYLAQYLKRAKLPGAEFEFRDQIRETREFVQLSIAKAEREGSGGKASLMRFETFRLSAVADLIDSDPVLALAALRIEIERKLRSLSEFLDVPSSDRASVPKLIEALARTGILSSDQIEALRRIVRICNGAIHGAALSTEEATEIVELATELNRSFSIGYSIDFSPNADYEQQGLTCEWEHCIELMPLPEQRTDVSCPVFGHDCPGGNDKVSVCGKSIGGIPRRRFATQ